MAGVDIAEVKRLYGNKVALCGNVHCAAMQTGTPEQVNVPADFDTKRKAFSGSKAPKKA